MPNLRYLLVAIYLAGLLFGYWRIWRGVRLPLYSGLLPMVCGGVAALLLTRTAMTSHYTGIVLQLLGLGIGVPLIAFGLGSFIAAIAGSLWNNRLVFSALAILSVAWPFGAMLKLDQVRSDGLAAQQTGLAAFQQSTVQAMVGDSLVYLPVAPNIGLEYDCSPPGSKRPKWCRTPFLDTVGFRLSGPQGGTLSTPPDIRSIFIRPVSLRDWCNRRTDPQAAD